MPAFVKTEKDEKDWQKAKKIVKKQYGKIEGNWPIVTHIFKNIQKGKSASRVVERWMGRRVASRWVEAKKPSYKDYVQRKKRDGEKPLSKEDWEVQVLGKKKEEGSDTEDGKLKSLVKGALSKIKAVGKVKDMIREAPKKVQKFLFDTDYRNEALSKAAESAKRAKKKAIPAIIEAAKGEAKAIFKDAPTILYKMAKEKRAPTKKEAKTLYGVGVYVAGTVLGTLGTAGLGPAAWGGSKALLHSMALHTAFRASSDVMDEAFLGYEATESVAVGADVAEKLPLATGDIPGLGHIMDFLADAISLIASEEIDSPEDQEAANEVLEELIEAFYDNVIKQMEKGFTDQEMKEFLEKIEA